MEIGVIKIPVQERPVFLTKDFGRLKKDVVYVRRGSSTTEAPLDEILKNASGIHGSHFGLATSRRRDFARYIATTALLNPLGFSLKNAGSALASNVRLELNIASHQDIMLIDEYAYPTRPSPNSRFDIPPVFGFNRNLSVDSHGKDLTIKVNFGSIQPGANSFPLSRQSLKEFGTNMREAGI